MKILSSLFFIAILAIVTGFSQQHKVTGTVYAFKDIPIKNVEIKAKKSGEVVLTDSSGYFSINCYENDRLIINANGFITRYLKVREKSDVRVKLVFKNGGKNEESAIGYGHISKSRLTNAVANLEEYNTDFANYHDIFDLIQGKLTGVQILNVEGEKQVVVRGVSSINLNTEALYVVDGMISEDISMIAPENVKNLSVLKDDAAAIYGSRGATGVVLIETLNNY